MGRTFNALMLKNEDKPPPHNPKKSHKKFSLPQEDGTLPDRGSRDHQTYYNMRIWAHILANKRMGLSDKHAFIRAGITEATFYRWAKKLDDPHCDLAIKTLFKDMQDIDQELEQDVIQVIVDEIKDNNNYVAALRFLELRWKYRHAHNLLETTNGNIRNVVATSSEIDTEKLTEKQRDSYQEILKAGKREADDDSVKVIIKLPPNGRD